MGWTDEDDMDEETDDEEHGEEQGMSNDVDLSELAPSAMGVNEAAEKDHTWKIMCWSSEGCGKTHLCYTMPEPVCFIDTENKADDIAHKFSDKVVQIWQPSDFDEAVDYRNEALSFLSEYESQTGQKGTIVVDSMDVMWDWAKHKYMDKYYENTNNEDVNLTLEDWGPIKKIHNGKFRQAMESCDFHVGWTATRKDDINSAIEENLDETPDKPGGESNNPYKVNSILRLKANDDGIPMGVLHKSGIVRFKYIGLRRPTFQKHKEIIEWVEEMEADGVETAEELENRYDLEYDLYGFTEANKMRYQG